MYWKTGKKSMKGKAVVRKMKRAGAARTIAALGLLLAAGLAMAVMMRRFRSRFSRPAPQSIHHLRASLDYRAPVDKVFGYWTAFSDFPRYLKEVAWARETGLSRFRFGLLNPAGGLAVWEIIVTRLVPDQYLEWYSTSKSQVQCSGRARFRNRPDSTRVDFEIEFGPGLGWMVQGMERFVKEEMPARIEADLSEETQSKPA